MYSVLPQHLRHYCHAIVLTTATAPYSGTAAPVYSSTATVPYLKKKAAFFSEGQVGRCGRMQLKKNRAKAHISGKSRPEADTKE